MQQKTINKQGIFYQRWLAKEGKANLIIAHGMAEHAKRYAPLATALNKANIHVYAIHHLGHGAAIEEVPGHWENKDFTRCVDNLDQLVGIALNENPGIPTFLLGHSMGSFMAQQYIKRYGKHIDGVLLSGSHVANAHFKLGRTAALFIGFFSPERKPNRLLDALSFGSFNKKFKPNRTKFDWLSRDEAQVDAYINDPLCGFVCTTSFFREFTANLARLNQKLYTVRYDLPIYIFSGDQDPVGNFGSGPQKLFDQYKHKCNVVDVTLKLYEGARHETINETNKEEVYQDIITWLNRYI